MKRLLLLTILITVLLSIKSQAQTYEFDFYEWEDKLIPNQILRDTNYNKSKFVFGTDSIHLFLEVEFPKDAVMHFSYAILGRRNEGRRYSYFITAKYKIFLDRKKEVVMVKDNRDTFLTIYHKK
jgi:hypothetical protein